VAPQPISWLGISASELGCFLLFWAAQAVIIVKGMESIRQVSCIPIARIGILCWSSNSIPMPCSACGRGETVSYWASVVISIRHPRNTATCCSLTNG
jgi:cytosine/uracil/thiamine/allantoin permease